MSMLPIPLLEGYPLTLSDQHLGIPTDDVPTGGSSGGGAARARMARRGRPAPGGGPVPVKVSYIKWNHNEPVIN
uniref:Uncharacterized protein n=1 Tax=Pristionchus pacificus TaxID=54126 RepID=A0A2A6BMP2_PRIPA|eukprot:PDM67242.1 hypothetical protein PRIPAC_48659 [Pristionchus pacificus]